jgi:transmembrane protein TMEM260 (protein O-mannosyltransferase)
MSDKVINRAVALGVFLVTAGIYLKTLSTTVVFWDVGEFCAAARLLEVPHPPGAPLFVFLARVASLIPYRDNIAARMHAISAVGSAFGIMFLYLIAVKLIEMFRGATQSVTDKIVVYGASAIGALALAFTTTYWDNSIEAEVYGMGMFFVSFCLWLALRWWEHAEEPHNEKYLLLIAYMLGLSTGVHILALLVTLPILMMIYFRKYQYSRKGFIQFSLVALAIFFVIYPGIVQFLPGLLDGEFKGVKSELFPFIPPLCVAAAAYGAYRSYRTHHKMVHIGCLSFLLIVVGYTTYTQVIIRSNVDNLPMKENNPNNLSRLTSYLTREQYGETPLLKGESWDNETQTFVEKIFPRRYSQEPMHEPTRVNYTSDGDFFWRYQVNHMFVRYVLWNFVGAEGDWQDAGVSWKESFGIPLFMALIGLYYHFRKDWKMASILMVMFIIMGIVLDLYQNQQDPQPRERDYFYVGAYFVFCVWIAIGIIGIYDFLRKSLQANVLSWAAPLLVVVFALTIPISLARSNWKEHDRSQNYIAWDYSYNLLQSCAQDAILFTNGDNDTFPLWYLQDVEGIRRDVRTVNLSLVNTQWYIHLLKNDTPFGGKKVALSLTDEQIDRIGPVRWNPRKVDLPVPKQVAERYGSTDSSVVNQGKIVWTMNGQPYQQDIRYLRVQDIMVRDIILSNRWERPIFFAVTSAPDSKIGLDNYLWMEGLALELRPKSFSSQEGGTDMKMMEANFLAKDVKPSKTLQYGYLFRNLNNPSVYYDENVQRMVMNYRAGFMRISDYYSRSESDKPKARQVMSLMEDVVPISVIPMQDWRYTFYVARIFNQLGEKERFDTYAKSVEAKCEELIASGQYDQADGSSNPYLILSEVYGMRKDYPKAIEMLNNLAVQFPDQNTWIKGQISMYDKLQKGGGVPDSNRPQ